MAKPHIDVSGEAQVWAHDAPGGWHFLTLPKPMGATLRDMTEGLRSVSGSIRVTATIGGTTWDTSVFPDSKRGSYVLPIKKSVRAAEGIRDGDKARFRLSVEV